MDNSLKQIDTKEVEFPDTNFGRDIENKVLQSIVVQCLLSIQGIGLVEGNLLDYFLGREPAERISGIHVEQDPKTRSIQVRIEINVAYGVVIADKADEIHGKVARELSRLTGLRVSNVHVVFKDLMTSQAPVEVTQEASRYSEIF